MSSGSAVQTLSKLSLSEGQSGTYTTSGYDGVWEGNTQEVNFKVNGQVRLYTVVVTLAYMRGDVDNDGDIDIDDVTKLIDARLKGYEVGPQGDCNFDNTTDINDITMLIQRLLTGVW